MESDSTTCFTVADTASLETILWVASSSAKFYIPFLMEPLTEYHLVQNESLVCSNVISV